MAGLIAGDGTSSAGRYAGVAPDANVVDVTHIREGVELHVRETGIQLVLQTEGREHSNRILDAIRAEGFAARPER